MSKKGTVRAAAAEKAEPVAVKQPASPKPLGRMHTDASPGARARLFVDTERGKGTKIELTGKRCGRPTSVIGRVLLPVLPGKAENQICTEFVQ